MNEPRPQAAQVVSTCISSVKLRRECLESGRNLRDASARGPPECRNGGYGRSYGTTWTSLTEMSSVHALKSRLKSLEIDV